MTAVLDNTGPVAVEGTGADRARLASWPARAGAFAMDVLAPAGLIVTLALLAWSVPVYGWSWWVCTVAAVAVGIAMLINRIALPAFTGWSLGRSVFGIRVMWSSGDAGLVRLLLRDLAHLLDTAALFVGWLWPLWDSRHRTFADLLTRTEVRCVDQPTPDARRRAGAVLVALAVLAGATAGLGYAAVYREDRALDQSREQIIKDGPRIVEQLLSYSVDSMDQDFARAQSLATDNYRPLVVAQQEAAKKRTPTNNDLFAVSSALLPGATKNKAAMLFAMQGQRGIDPKDLKFITATVRVDFVKVDGQWQADNLTVLKQPLLSGAGQ
ncbi:RDD family protein [Mycolicibacterium alvei]|uniref:RDD family protein n=1 Tax=Mycolicibacterium alvei TaxID=67081 RepID=A0A6N4UWQ0_9MYCO|nr:RDD family protein [Mycolicibacterium alvei]MCV7001809.1 RDD family protein [Mycolicibacterium alvei]BBX28263.1 RDD family protein [Mycolicibacterium alvei]